MTTTGMIINGTEGNNRLTGGSGNDVINGNGGNDRLNGGSGADILNGGAGKDELNGGSGNDNLDGGSGSDELEGGSGNDTLIYTLAENNVVGRMIYDEYEGGSGTDTLELRFTRAEWMNTNNQTVLQNYINWASKSGSGCRWDDDFTFRFSNAKLEIEDIEKLVVKVDGATIENLGTNTVVAVEDIIDISEDSTGKEIYVLGNDKVNYLVKDLKLERAPLLGTVTLIKPTLQNGSIDENTNNWYFKYSPDNAYQYLKEGEPETESFTYKITDTKGTSATGIVNINITGVNDKAEITFTTPDPLIEDSNFDPETIAVRSSSEVNKLIINGTIYIADIDKSESELLRIDPFINNLGQIISESLTQLDPISGEFIRSDVRYFYTIENSKVQFLGEGKTHIDSFYVRSKDGTSETISFTTTGVNDVAEIAGEVMGTVTESGSNNDTSLSTTTGELTINDIDNFESSFKPEENKTTTYGKFSITSEGVWTYELDNDNNDVNRLNVAGSLTDSFKIYSADNTEQIITINITGANDAAVIGDPLINQLREDTNVNFGSLNLTSFLSINDIDNDSRFISGLFISQAGLGELNFLGGQYIYYIQNFKIQFLSEGQQLTDSYTVKAVDGTPKTISFTITGVNDVAEIAGEVTGIVTESGISNDGGSSTTTGQLTINDIDNFESSFKAEENKTTTYGKFSITSEGVWTYTLDNDNEIINALNSNSTDLEDTFTIKSIDGTPQSITIIIQGANDVVNSAPVVKELGIGDNKYAGSANVEELINLKYDNPTIAEYVARGGDFDYLHVRTGQFSFSDSDLTDIFTITSTAASPEGNLGTLTFDNYTNAIDSDGNNIYVVKWTYTVKDRDLESLNTPAAGSSSKDDDFIVTIGDGTTTIDTKIMLNLSGRDEIEFVDGYNDGNNVYVDPPDSDRPSSSIGNDVLYAGDGNDKFFVNTLGSQVSYGENGNDQIYATRGNTVLFGGDGDDILGFEFTISNTLAFGGNGNDYFGFVGDITTQGRKAYMWGGAGSDFFEVRNKQSKSIDWVMDFDSRKPIDGGDKINFFLGATDFNWEISGTNLEKKSADAKHPFLSEGAEYYDLQINRGADLNNPIWFSILNLVGISGTEITLDSLIANGNLV